MPYLPQADIDGLVALLIASPSLSSSWVDSWFSALPAAYAAGLPPAVVPVSERIRVALAHMNAAPPLEDDVLPLVVALERLVLEPEGSIVARAKQLLSRIELEDGAAPSLQSVFGQHRLAGAALFADRTTLRERLVRLAGGDGPPAVIVNGAPRAGKSHTRKLLAHVAQRTSRFRLAWVEIEKEQAPSYTPDWLIEDLVRSLVPGAPSAPPPREPTPRWLNELASWAVGQIVTLGADRPVWLAIDGLRLPGVHPDVLGVVERLAVRVATPNAQPELRLVLIDCDPVGIARTQISAEQEEVAHLTAADAEARLKLLLDAQRFPVVWARVQASLSKAKTLTTPDVSDAVAEALR